MTKKEYLTVCIKFAEDTATWGGLENKYYSTDSTYDAGWVETTDNEHGGIDVSWAFHQSPKYIEEHAADEFLANFQSEMDLLEEAETKETALRTALIVRALFSSPAVYDANAAADEANSIIKETWE